jgi:hypothetical protein
VPHLSSCGHAPDVHLLICDRVASAQCSPSMPKDAQPRFLGIAKCGIRVGVVAEPAPGCGAQAVHAIRTPSGGGIGVDETVDVVAEQGDEPGKRAPAGRTTCSAASTHSRASTIPFQAKRQNENQDAECSSPFSRGSTLSRGSTPADNLTHGALAPASQSGHAATAPATPSTADLESQIALVFEQTIGGEKRFSQPLRAGDMPGGGGGEEDEARDALDHDARGVAQFFERGGFDRGEVLEVSVQSLGAARQVYKFLLVLL